MNISFVDFDKKQTCIQKDQCECKKHTLNVVDISMAGMNLPPT